MSAGQASPNTSQQQGHSHGYSDAREKQAPADEATDLVRAAIRAHVPAAVAELARLAAEASSETARIAAINALIDRGYGRLKDHHDEDERDGGITVRFVAPPPAKA